MIVVPASSLPVFEVLQHLFKKYRVMLLEMLGAHFK